MRGLASRREGQRIRRLTATVACLTTLVGACSGPILANPTTAPFPIATVRPASTPLPDPQPIVFPRDDGAHRRLTEWWYYTGHLTDGAGGRWGFEYVIFRAERGAFPVTWAAHLALTDETTGTFVYDQRSEIGPQVDQSSADAGVRLVVGDPGAPSAVSPVPGGSVPNAPASGNPPASGNAPAAWMMDGPANHLSATSRIGRFGIDLALATQPGSRPVLHGGNGWIDFGPAGSSYYYSRPRLTVTGGLTVDGRQRSVTGTAWFDHQWGDFISVGGVGWDWFAVNLADGTDLTISRVRAADGNVVLVYGTLSDVTGRATNLDRGAFTVTAQPGRTWTSPRTGAVYPAAWTIEVPSQGLVIRLRPTVADQELDTRATTGVVYWEGSQIVSASRDGIPIGGEAYVELTGYGPPAP